MHISRQTEGRRRQIPGRLRYQKDVGDMAEVVAFLAEVVAVPASEEVNMAEENGAPVEVVVFLVKDVAEMAQEEPVLSSNKVSWRLFSG